MSMLLRHRSISHRHRSLVGSMRWSSHNYNQTNQQRDCASIFHNQTEQQRDCALHIPSAYEERSTTIMFIYSSADDGVPSPSPSPTLPPRVVDTDRKKDVSILEFEAGGGAGDNESCGAVTVVGHGPGGRVAEGPPSPGSLARARTGSALASASIVIFD